MKLTEQIAQLEDRAARFEAAEDRAATLEAQIGELAQACGYVRREEATPADPNRVTVLERELAAKTMAVAAEQERARQLEAQVDQWRKRALALEESTLPRWVEPVPSSPSPAGPSAPSGDVTPAVSTESASSSPPAENPSAPTTTSGEGFVITRVNARPKVQRVYLHGYDDDGPRWSPELPPLDVFATRERAEYGKPRGAIIVARGAELDALLAKDAAAKAAKETAAAAPTEPATEAVEPDREWTEPGEQVDLESTATAKYLLLVRGADDPAVEPRWSERDPETRGERPEKDARRRSSTVPPEEVKAMFLADLGEHPSSTFNAMCVRKLGCTADNAAESVVAALWELVADGRLVHTFKAPVRFQLVPAVADAVADEQVAASEAAE